MSNNISISKACKVAFKEHLEEKLKEINSDYIYTINWFVDIEKRKLDIDPRADVQDKEIFIVLTPLPSRSFGDNSIEQQIEITTMCNFNDTENAIDILTEYQDSNVNKKWWTADGTLINETWFSPTIQEPMFNLKLGKGSTINMQGTISFTPDVLDILKIIIFGDWVKTFEFYESAVADSLPFNYSTSVRKKAKNRSLIYKIDLKCKSSNNAFCQTLKQWKESQQTLNVTIPIEIVYTDGTSVSHKMVVQNAVFTTGDGLLPTWSVSLMEKM